MALTDHLISPYEFFSGSDRDLSPESLLRELPLHQFQVTPNCLGIEVAQVLEQHPLLPGVVLVEQGKFAGMVSRRRLLESLLRPHRLSLFLHKPLHVLYRYVASELLVLSEQTPILAAAQQAMRRSPELLAEPIVVRESETVYKLLDVPELQVASWQIRGIETQVRYERNQAQMIQSEKMASLGRLVDGVAHEILDPVGFIWGNLSYISTYCDALIQLMETYDQHFPNTPADIQKLKDEIDYLFIQEDLPRAVSSARSGAERLKRLATSLQNFCHIDDVYPKPADLHATLDSIILLLKSRLGGDIEIIRNYGNLPPVRCFGGELYQVFMNILSHAIDVLIDRAVNQRFTADFPPGKPRPLLPKPKIEITTQVIPQGTNSGNVGDSRWVSICIADNGPGMEESALQQIQESFRVENRAAKETSLTVSYRIVTAKHGGKLRVRSPKYSPADSEDSKGTEFEILLPLI